MQKKEIEALVEALLAQEGAELVDLRYAKEGPKWVLRAFVDKPSGVTIDDCAYLSDRIGGLLDSEKAIERSYVLEVSSPGLDRVVKKPADFQRFAGRRINVRLRLPENGQRNFHSVLRGFEDGGVVLEDEGGRRRFALDSIEEARLEPEVEI